jgi:hypothetical protein
MRMWTVEQAFASFLPENRMRPNQASLQAARPRKRSAPQEGAVFETTGQSASERLGQRFDAAWEAGSGLTLEEAVALLSTKE